MAEDMRMPEVINSESARTPLTITEQKPPANIPKLLHLLRASACAGMYLASTPIRQAGTP